MRCCFVVQRSAAFLSRIGSRRPRGLFNSSYNLPMAKRKHSGIAAVDNNHASVPPLLTQNSSRGKRARTNIDTDPATSNDVIDGLDALRASPDSDINEKITPADVNGRGAPDSESPLSDLSAEPSSPIGKKPATSSKKKRNSKQTAVDNEGEEDVSPESAKTKKAKASLSHDEEGFDPENAEEEEVDPEELQQALSRPPAVNSDYLPLPWKGRLGYACLCTYLRYSNPTIFTSRTTRIASILEHRHPLKDPTQPEHATKNRPDKEQPADVRRGQEFVEQLCLANVKDMAKVLRWNDKYNIKFFRLSSEAFPFASHPEYGYKLAPFAADALAQVGKVVAELGHRVSTHPGQFTQLGSPRESVIENAIRDLEYHDEMLSLLKLPPQQDRDAIMVLHMGGVFGDKQATLDRFRKNYAPLSQSIKNRLVLENDDVSWTVHDLLPVCEELNIPMVLDYHHHNIMFDADKIREGTKDIMDLYPRIRATWTRKNITQKMHYSEPTPAAITGRQRRKHNPRVATLPPCPNDMDLMIEAKDKEQAVFELMRTFKLPGFEKLSDLIPHVRSDENKPVRPQRKKAATPKKGKKGAEAAAEAEENNDDASTVNGDDLPTLVPEEEVGMGGLEGRVYWPPGMEEWLRPKKRVVKKKDPDALTPAQKRAANMEKAKAAREAAAALAADVVKEEALENGDGAATPKQKGRKGKASTKASTAAAATKPEEANGADTAAPNGNAKTKGKAAPKSKAKAAAKAAAKPTPAKKPKKAKKEELDDEEDEDHLSTPPSSEDEHLSAFSAASDEDEKPVKRSRGGKAAAAPKNVRSSARAKALSKSYRLENEEDDDDDDDDEFDE